MEAVQRKGAGKVSSACTCHDNINDCWWCKYKTAEEALQIIAHRTMSMYYSQGEMAKDFKKIALEALNKTQNAQ
jgi:hypothetical protein